MSEFTIIERVLKSLYKLMSTYRVMSVFRAMSNI